MPFPSCCVNDAAEVEMRRQNIATSPLPSAAQGADTRKFREPVEGWLTRLSADGAARRGGDASARAGGSRPTYQLAPRQPSQ